MDENDRLSETEDAGPETDATPDDEPEAKHGGRDRPLTRRALLDFYEHVAGPEGLDRRKPRTSRKATLRRLATVLRGRDVLIPAAFHYLERFLAKEDPADELEERISGSFATLEPSTLERGEALLDAYRSLDEETRSALFAERYRDLAPNEPLLAEELLIDLRDQLEAMGVARAYTEATGAAVEPLRPAGRARCSRGPSDPECPGSPAIPYPPHPWVCSVQGLRTADHVPRLPLDDYHSIELETEPPTDAGPERDAACDHAATPRRRFAYELFGRPFVEEWEGDTVDGACLRLPEAIPGGEVTLTGFNFHDPAATVHLWRVDDPGRRWTVPTLTLGDPRPSSGPAGEADESAFEARDVLVFRIPPEFSLGVYRFQVEASNHVGYRWPTHGTRPDALASRPTPLRVVPRGTRYRISVVRIDCEDETFGCGSDELLLSRTSINVAEQAKPTLIGSQWRFDADTGDVFHVDLELFAGSVNGFGSVGLLGLEVDDGSLATKYQQEWSDLFSSTVGKAFEEFFEGLHKECNVWFVGGADDDEGATPAAWVVGAFCYVWGAIVGVVINVVKAIFTFGWSLWAPPDLLIEDLLVFGQLNLRHLTSPSVPLPSPSSHQSPQGVDVSVRPLRKADGAYFEKRTYKHSGATYSLTLRYERIGLENELVHEALFGRMI